MKKIVFALLLMISAVGVNAQNNLVTKQANELTKLTLLRMQSSEVSVENGVAAKAYPIIEKYFTAKAAAVKDLTNAQILEKDAAGEFATLVSKRDEAIKNILTTEQYTKWLSISPGLFRTIEQVQ
jgi:hypothetical protein